MTKNHDLNRATGGLPTSFESLIAPITPLVFFRDYYGKKPLLIKGSREKIAGLPAWGGLESLLNQSAIWSAKSLQLVLDRHILPPAQYCTMEQDLNRNDVMRPVPERISHFLSKGASLIANNIDSLTPQLSQIASILENALDGKAQANLYASAQARQAFNSHFDSHDVFAFHIEGQKNWKIYETKQPDAIRHPRHSNAAFNEDAHVKRRGKVMMDIILRPGDLLYIPKGQYHDALACAPDSKDQTDMGSIHVAYGITTVIGLDVLELASDLLVEQPIFRQSLPRHAEGAVEMRTRIRALGKAFDDLSKQDDFIDRLREWQLNYRYPRASIALPIAPEQIAYQVQSGFRLAETQKQVILKGPKGALAIPQDRLQIVTWILRQTAFDRYEFMNEFAALPTNQADQYLQELIDMAVIRQIKH